MLVSPYASSVPWKSRCSTLRFVNAPAAKWMPSARPSSMAWLETSIETASTPSSARSRNSRARSVASGVVNPVSTTRSPRRNPSVPRIATSECRAASTAAVMNVVVVFPLVPVTPTTVRSRVGSPWIAWLTGPSASRTSSTTMVGIPQSPARDTIAATAPAPAAAATKSWPSRSKPGMAANREPGSTRRLSCVTPVGRTSGSPSTRPPESRASSASVTDGAGFSNSGRSCFPLARRSAARSLYESLRGC